MPLVPMRALLDHAAENDYGLAAFNVNNMEQIQAIMAAAVKTDSPVIIQASKGARSYTNDAYLRHLMLAAVELHPNIPIAMHQDHGDSPVIIQASKGARSYTNDAYLRHLMLAAVELHPNIPIAMHQDHGDSPETCFSAIEQGFTSVMMDGSLEADGKTPASYEYNVKVTRKVVDAAHAKGITVEGELGTLGGIEDGHGAGLSMEEAQKHLTDPDQAEQFVADTKVDALAVAIGTSHGAYKFTKKPTGDVLVMSVIEEIHKRLPNTHMVMHGSSSVPQELLEIIRQYGGEMKETYGVPVEEIQRGIKHGVRKVNVDTDNRLAITGAIRKVFATKKGEFDPRKYLSPARDAMEKVCVARMTAFGQAGNAGKIEPVTCKQMVSFYQK